MVVTMDTHFFLVAFLVWYGIGFFSLVFWDVVISGYRHTVKLLIDDFFMTAWKVMTLSLFGPLVFLFCLVLYALLEEVFNKKTRRR